MIATVFLHAIEEQSITANRTGRYVFTCGLTTSHYRVRLTRAWCSGKVECASEKNPILCGLKTFCV